jgi:glycine betaine/proline transport system ATP-binding protein
VLDNVCFGLEITGLPKKKKLQAAYEAIDLVGLSSWSMQYPRELSGGMQQRVGLARAIATKSDILLMDEPFSALDPLTKSHLQDELLSLQARFKKTIIFVTHDFEEAMKIGSRIALLQDGLLVQEGLPKEILCNPKTLYVQEFVAQTQKKLHFNQNVVSE